MFNMKTSDLFKRAKQLADLEGSDFISWNEAINCINESNVGLYEKLINMGDNSFVKSYRTTKEEEELPEDFWQLKGVFLWNNGNLQTINRRADNNGTHHLSYELRNGKLYLFGKPNDVLVEYFPKPEKLFFKPYSVAISLEDKDFIDCYKHTFLYKDTDSENNNTLSLYDLDGIKTMKDFIQISHNDILQAWLTDNFVFIKKYVSVNSYNLIIFDIIKNKSFSYESTQNEYAYPIITEYGNAYLYKKSSETNGIFSFSISSEEGLVEEKIEDVPYIINGLCVCDEDLTDFFYMGQSKIMHNGVEVNIGSVEIPNKLFYSEKDCYYLYSGSYHNLRNTYTKSGFGVIHSDNTYELIDKESGLNVGIVGINKNTGYGYCSKKYGKYYVNSYCEDTPLNYPNSTYFQIISYILAIAFKSKQGADITLLQNQLAMIEQTFEETLGSDAFQFPRMGNVYN